jgi:hypothetical protein
MSRFVVMTATAKMPASVRSRYRRVAVVETDLPEPELPARIDIRDSHVLQIVETWERCNVGMNVRSAYARALAEAEAMVERLSK